MRIKWKNMINEEINGYKVFNYKRENNRTQIFVSCKYCGKKFWTRPELIKENISCGCRKSIGLREAIDITGEIYGRLTAIKPTKERSNNGSVIWECKCICGKTKLVSAGDLKKGVVKSCGCLQKEILKENGKNCAKYIKDNFFIDGTYTKLLTAKIPRHNTSGIKGVCWNKGKNKWIAQIEFKRRHYYLGSYNRIEDAEEIRKIAEKKLFGDFLKWYEEQKKH